MGRVIGLFVLLSLSISSGAIRAQELIDFGSCNLKVIEVREIEGFTGEKGKMVRPSRRDAGFVEVEIEMNPDSSGAFGLYPAMFSALFRYRGVVQVVPAVALGTKIVDRLTREKREYWYNEPDVSIILEFEAGECFSKYVVLEIPKEVSAFQLQGPAIIQSLRLGHAQ